MLRNVLCAAVVAGYLFVPGAVAPAKAAYQTAEILLNQYSIYRASSAARYFTPGSLIMGWPFKGVLRLEMDCSNKVDVDADNMILKAPLQQGDFSGDCRAGSLISASRRSTS